MTRIQTLFTAALLAFPILGALAAIQYALTGHWPTWLPTPGAAS